MPHTLEYLNLSIEPFPAQVAAVKADEDALSAARNTSNEVELQTKVAVKAAEMYAESEASDLKSNPNSNPPLALTLGPTHIQPLP